MKKLVGFLIFALSMIANSCSSDHDHFRGDYYDDYATHYYYYDGFYYSDPEHHYRYDHDEHHYYYGRLEWKGEHNGWAVVLRENPYYGLICYVKNSQRFLEDQLGYHNVYDREVMVRFHFLGYDEHGHSLIDITHIYYR